jgi:hypothetical protein
LKEKLKLLLKILKKTSRPDTVHTFVIDYNSPQVEYHAEKLMNKMKIFAPEFIINSCYRSKKVLQLYSYTFKPSIDIFDTSNVVYKRQLKHRVKEHQQASFANKKTPNFQQKHNNFRQKSPNFQQKGIYHHISNCDCYRTNLKHYFKTCPDHQK